jgi:uncharacterized repeat protein (TIGR01451 family)
LTRSATDKLDNTATVTAPTGVTDPNTANNSATDSDTIIATAELSVTTTDSPDPVPVGGTLTYAITVNNGGPSSAMNVTLADTLPASVTFGSATPSQGSCTQSGSTVTCNLGSIADGGLATVTITVTPNATGTISNTATVSANESDPNGANNTATVTTTVNKADTTTTITSDSPDPSVVGQPYTVSFTVAAQSPGSGTPVGSVTISDGTGATCSGTLSGGMGSCQLTSTTAGAKTLTATYGGDSNVNGSSGTAALHVNKANTTTTVTSSQNPSTYGQPVTFTATVTAIAPGGDTPKGTATFYDGATVLDTGTLNSLGQATFTTSTLFIGVHSIAATYNGNSNYNSSASPPLLHTVVEPPSTESAKVTGGGSIPLTTGDSGTFGLAGTISSAGVPSGNVEYQDHDTGMNVKATRITSVVVTGTHAQVFGKATINGSGSFDFVVDVDDIAESGVNVDTFSIKLSNGYVAGPRVLNNGNIQVHK